MILLGLNRLCFQGKLAEVERQDAEKIQKTEREARPQSVDGGGKWQAMTPS
jgi:hypothetical protein